MGCVRRAGRGGGELPGLSFSIPWQKEGPSKFVGERTKLEGMALRLVQNRLEERWRGVRGSGRGRQGCGVLLLLQKKRKNNVKNHKFPRVFV